MKKPYLRSVFFFSLALLIGFSWACQTTVSPQRQVDDAAITTAVKAKLASELSISSLANIEVNTTNGIVTLAGQVSNEDQKIKAQKLALQVNGVVRVNNALQISKEPQ